MNSPSKSVLASVSPSGRGRMQLSEADQRAVVREATRLLPSPARRRFLAGGATVGGLAMLTGCSVTDSSSVDDMLSFMSRFNDRVQGWLFNPNDMAPTYAESQMTRPFQRVLWRGRGPHH
jgi:hypothetical protein